MERSLLRTSCVPLNQRLLAPTSSWTLVVLLVLLSASLAESSWWRPDETPIQVFINRTASPVPTSGTWVVRRARFQVRETTGGLNQRTVNDGITVLFPAVAQTLGFPAEVSDAWLETRVRSGIFYLNVTVLDVKDFSTWSQLLSALDNITIVSKLSGTKAANLRFALDVTGWKYQAYHLGPDTYSKATANTVCRSAGFDGSVWWTARSEENAVRVALPASDTDDGRTANCHTGLTLVSGTFCFTSHPDYNAALCTATGTSRFTFALKGPPSQCHRLAMYGGDCWGMTSPASNEFLLKFGDVLSGAPVIITEPAAMAEGLCSRLVPNVWVGATTRSEGARSETAVVAITTTVTNTPTITSAATGSASQTKSLTVSVSTSASPSGTTPLTPSVTLSRPATPSASLSATKSVTATPSSSSSVSSSTSATPSVSATSSKSSSETRSLTPSLPPTQTSVRTVTASPMITITRSTSKSRGSPTLTESRTLSATASSTKRTVSLSRNTRSHSGGTPTVAGSPSRSRVTQSASVSRSASDASISAVPSATVADESVSAELTKTVAVTAPRARLENASIPWGVFLAAPDKAVLAPPPPSVPFSTASPVPPVTAGTALDDADSEGHGADAASDMFYSRAVVIRLDTGVTLLGQRAGSRPDAFDARALRRRASTHWWQAPTVGPGFAPCTVVCAEATTSRSNSTLCRYVAANVSVHLAPSNNSFETSLDAAARPTVALLAFAPFTQEVAAAVFGDLTPELENGPPVTARVQLVAGCFSSGISPASAPLEVSLEGPRRVASDSEASAKKATSTARTTVATVGLFASGGAVAAQVSRTAFALGLLQCEPDQTQMDWMQDPLHVPVGGDDSWVSFYAGPAVCNIALVCGVGALQVSVAWLLSTIGDTSTYQAFAIVRYPSFLAFVILLLTDSTALGAIVSIVFGHHQHRIAGAVALIVLLALGVVLYRRFRPSQFKGTLVAADDPELPPEARMKVEGWRLFLFGHFKWHDTATLTLGQMDRAKARRIRDLQSHCVYQRVYAGEIAEYHDAQSQAEAAAFDAALLETGGDEAAARLVAKLNRAEASASVQRTWAELQQKIKQHDRGVVVGFCRSNKMFFDEYNDRVPHFYVFEYCVTLLVGVLEGIKLGSGKCAVVGAVFMGLMFVYLTAILVLRPQISVYEAGFSIVATSLQLASAVLFVVGWFAAQPSLFQLSPLLVEIGMWLLIAKVAMDMLIVLLRITVRAVLYCAFRGRDPLALRAGSKVLNASAFTEDAAAPLLGVPSNIRVDDVSTASESIDPVLASLQATLGPTAPRDDDHESRSPVASASDDDSVCLVGERLAESAAEEEPPARRTTSEVSLNVAGLPLDFDYAGLLPPPPAARAYPLRPRSTSGAAWQPWDDQRRRSAFDDQPNDQSGSSNFVPTRPYDDALATLSAHHRRFAVTSGRPPAVAAGDDDSAAFLEAILAAPTAEEALEVYRASLL
jgi:hypothetical protein